MKCKINYSRKSVVESYMNDNLDNKEEIQIHEHLRHRFLRSMTRYKINSCRASVQAVIACDSYSINVFIWECPPVTG